MCPRRGGSGGRPRRWFVVAVALLRALAVLVAIQSSGALHFAVDVIALATGEPHGDDCADGANDHSCPPGCPSCHASCGFLASLPPPDGAVVELPVAASQPSPPVAREQRAPASTERTSIYRPPRRTPLA